MSGAKFHRPQSAVKNQNSGYTTKVYMAYLEDFTSVEVPTVLTTPANALEIITDHTFAATKGFAKCYALPNSVKADADTYGDPGAINKLHKGQFFLPGDSSDVEAMSREMMNRELIMLFEETDPALPYKQYGSERTPAVVTKVTYSSGDQFSGQKGFMIEFQTVAEYFYTGTVTLQG